MKNKIWMYVIGAVCCALCLMGCNRTNVPNSTKDPVQPTATVEATVKETDGQVQETESAGETMAVIQPTENKDEDTQATEPSSNSNNGQQTSQETQTPNGNGVTYESYNAMSAEDQQAFYLSFADPQDFFNWYNKAKEEYDKSNDNIIVGEDGVIDLEDLIGGSVG